MSKSVSIFFIFFVGEFWDMYPNHHQYSNNVSQNNPNMQSMQNLAGPPLAGNPIHSQQGSMAQPSKAYNPEPPYNMSGKNYNTNFPGEMACLAFIILS